MALVMTIPENGHAGLGRWPDLLTLIPHLRAVDLGERQTSGAARQSDRHQGRPGRSRVGAAHRGSDAEGTLDRAGRAEHSTDGRPRDPRLLNLPTYFKAQRAGES